MSNVEAFEATLAHLEEMGRLETVDSALVELVRTCATRCDARDCTAAMLREYRDALKELIHAGRDVDDAAAVLTARLAALGGSAATEPEVGDPAN